MKIIHSDSSSNRHRSADLKNDSAGLPDLLRLPYDFRPSQEMEYKKGTFRFILDGFLLEKFQAMVSGHDTTKPLILLTGFGILLSRYSIQNDFLIGVPMVRSYTSNQDSMKHRPVDIVPVRYQMQDDNSFGDALVNMKGSFQSLSAGADVQHPYGSGDPSRVSEKEIKPAYQVVFNYLTPFEEEINLPGVTPQMLNGQLKSLKTDLLLSIVDHSTTMECILEYNSGSFTADTISRMAGHYKTILRAVTHHEDLKIIKIPILTGTESHQLLQVWNETSKIYAKDKCMHQLFEEQVERTPDSVAVVYEDDTATYREVNMRANQLAHYLVRNGAREDTIVALCMERGINMLVALLAISKSGASYLPVDPIYPKARQDSILTDAKPVFLLTQSSLLDSIPVTDLKTILFDTRDLVKEEPSGNLSFGNSDKPLYVLYTSGSTGKPKGVPVRHNSTVNVVNSLSRLIGVTDKDILFTVTTIAFDLAELDIYMTLLSGARLVIGSQEAAMNMELLIKKLDESKATLFQATPITYKMLIRAGWKGKSDLKIISGGDAMTKELGKQLLSRCLEVWNCWGPTETTIYNTGKKVTEEDTSGEGLVSIGKPLDNNTLYVLNQGMIPVPVGVGGEVYIGGDGISPGYLNLPELTAEKFIQNPFSKDPGDILYKSGDLVKYLPDGNLAFLSRVDTQVKIRGFRIELEEIESVLLRYEGIRETIVIAREDVPGEKKLVAYYSLKPGIDILHHDLRRFLAEKLPEYMIPSAFVRLNTLPLTANNKVDRKALPVPDLTEMESDPDFIPPSTDIEKRLAVIWQEVLDLPTISIDTNFFEAGGHSLTATQVLSKVNTEFHLELPFRIIFENFTIRELTRYIGQSVPNTTRAREMHKISPKPVSGANGSPLSSSQQRIWFLENLDESIRAYNIPLDFKISGPLDIQALNAAINVLISRHEAFRTLFLDTMGEPVQKIIPELRGDIEIVHLEEKPTEELQGLIADYSLENARFKFHLARGPLFRFQLLVLRNHEFIFLINFHHIIFDAVSIKIFLDELKLVYGALINKSSPDLPLLPVTYSDYSSWQHQWLKGVECKRQMEFLKTELSGVPDVLQLPLDFPRPKAQTYHGREYHFIVDPELKNKLIAAARKGNISLSVSLLTAFAVLLHRYSLQDDFVLGFPVANRMQPELESMIGVFINSLPIRFTFPRDISFSDMTLRTMERFLSAYENQEVPLEGLVEELKVKRNMNVNPIFQVLFNYLAVIPGEVDMSGVRLQMLKGERMAAQFDLTLTVNDQNSGLDCVFEYNTDLYREETIGRMAGHYLNILRAVTSNENIGVLDIPLLTEPETKLMLHDWNQTDTGYPEDKCTHHLFEAQVSKTPDAIAVTYENESLTYTQLNERANRLASFLVKKGAKEGTVVAIFMNRSIDMLVGLLAVAKSGAAYLPLDPIYPKGRLELIFTNATPLLVLTQHPLAGQIPETEARVIFADDTDTYAHEPVEDLSFGNPQSPAYILYTSGSTGKPKGVQIRHHSVVNLVSSMGRMLKVTGQDILLGVTTIAFDIAEMEMYLPLFNGARLVIASAETAMDVGLLKKKIEDSGATLFQATPVTFKMLLLDGWKGKPDLKVVCGGEAFSRELARFLVSHCREVWNGYGPTETAIYSVVKKLEAKDIEGEGYAPIGRPIDNTRVYVLNSGMVPVPVGIAGELFIGGAGVSPGYLGLPEMTAERFFPDPFTNDPASKLYKTGDLVRYFENGDLIFLNRIDSQVKIRGFRIELGEIESALSRIPGIKENVVVAIDDGHGEKMLAAYYIPEEKNSIQDLDIRKNLKSRLPDYMIPVAFISMDKFPLTANNKIDRKALPEPVFNPDATDRKTVAPVTLTEKKLCAIWSSILKMDTVGIHDDFFEIGGHSMIAVSMMIKIETEFGVRLPLATLFEQSTVHHLGALIDKGLTPDKWRSLVPIKPQGSRKPLFLVHGMGLNVLLYTSVINHLDPEQPVYGLQAKGLDGRENPLATIESIASYYISEIMTVDKEGPYRLAGFSLGGTIAFEMACQLTEMGKKVSFLGLIDTDAEEFIYHLPFLRLMVARAKHNLKYFSWNISYFLKAPNMSKLDVLKRRYRGLEKKLTGLDFKISKDVTVSKGEQRELPRYLRKVHRANKNAVRNYVFRRYSGSVHLFKAQNQTFYINDPVNYGWNKYAHGGVVIHLIPGEHSTTFAPPNDRNFALILQSCLNEN